MDKIIGIGEFAISRDQDGKIKTFALGSCVAVTVYCPEKKVMGMVHIALPDSTIQPDKGRQMPGYFADTAVPLVIDKICMEYGCKKDNLVVNIFGGANSIRQIDTFNIGRKNVNRVKKILEDQNIKCLREETGGTISRTLEADVATGEIRVETQPLII